MKKTKKTANENVVNDTTTNAEAESPKKEKKLSYWQIKGKAILFQILNVIIFLIPLAIMLIVYRDEIFTKKSGTGISGLAIIGIILYICGLKKVLGKFPTIVWFLIIFLVCVFADYVSAFLVKISLNMLIGYVFTIPLTIYIRKLNKNAELVDNLTIIKKYKEQNKDSEAIEEAEISGRV